MARVLVATVPLTGHVHPMAIVVRELVARGHEVAWYGGRKFEPQIRAAGAAFLPMQHARDWDDADLEGTVPELRGRRGLARVKAQVQAMFVGPMPDQARDLDDIAAAHAPEAILADQAHLGAAAFSERRALPYAEIGISALMLPSRDTAPFGPGFLPARGVGARVRNAMMNWLVHHVMFGGINRAYRRARIAAGLPRGRGTYFEAMSPYLYLQPTIPDFEYPRGDLPAQVHFIGPLVPDPAPGTVLPRWWSDVADATRRGVPIVLVTQGTMAIDERDLLAPTVRALAGEELLVIATGRLGAGVALPANARAAPYIPYQALLPHVAAVITNGGYGGVQMALAHGVPLVVAGGSEEKPEIAARVRWSGSGIDLRTGRPTEPAIRTAVRRVLDDARFRAAARALGAQMARYDAPTRAAELIETMIARRAPVLRDGVTPRQLAASN